MKKPTIALLFSFLFLAILAAPSLALINSNHDIVLLMDLGEEESKEGKEGKEGKEINADIEFKVLQACSDYMQLAHLHCGKNSGFYSISYASEISNQIFTPPEHIS